MNEMKLLTVTDVARILGFKPRTIARWCREGMFPTAVKVGRVWRISHTDLRLHMLVNTKAAKELHGPEPI